MRSSQSQICHRHVNNKYQCGRKHGYVYAAYKLFCMIILIIHIAGTLHNVQAIALSRTMLNNSVHKYLASDTSLVRTKPATCNLVDQMHKKRRLQAAFSS